MIDGCYGRGDAPDEVAPQDEGGPLPSRGQEEAVPSSPRGPTGAPDKRRTRQARRALRAAVHAYARDPCEVNASKVRLAIASLRLQRVRERR
jgi:hypothetical protein